MKKILGVFLAAMMIMSVMVIAPVSVSAATNTFDIATYSSSDEFTISTEADLLALSAAVDTKNYNFSGKTITLANDINVTGTWSAIGTGDNSYIDNGHFRGTFNGNGKTINLGNQTVSTSTEGALFGGLGEGAVVENLKLLGNITVTGSSSINYIGSIACRVAKTVVIRNVHSSVNITRSGGQLAYAGGFIGFIQNNATASVTITNCIYDGDINCGNQVTNLGGFIGCTGKNDSYAKNTYINNSVFAGRIMLNDTNYSTEIGGFLGYMQANSNSKATNLYLENIISVGTITFRSGEGVTWTANSGNWGAIIGGFAASKTTSSGMTTDTGSGQATIKKAGNIYYRPITSPLGQITEIGAYPNYTAGGTGSTNRMDRMTKEITAELTASDFTAYSDSGDANNNGDAATFNYKAANELNTFYPCPTALAPANGWVASLTVGGDAKVLGAAIRCTDAADTYSGLRFVSMFNNSTAGIANGGAADANFGIILISKAKYDAAADKASVAGLVAAGGVQVKATKVDTSVDGYTKVSAVIYNIQSANYEDEVVAVSYVNDTLVGASDCESIYTVAVKCVEQNDDTPAALAFAQQIKNAVESN